MKVKTRVILTALASLFAASAMAAVSAEEAKQLGGATLTTWGAEKAGNKDGTIPAYTGTPIKVPASYDPKVPEQHPDPFGDKPLFTITAQNMAQYADRLTEGIKATFKAYPDFRMNVYQTHRTVIFPKYVLENTVKNATACHTIDNGVSLEGCYGGIPFPIPKTGMEAMWNHLAGYEAYSWGGNTSNWMIPPNGAPALQGISAATQENPFYDPAHSGVNGPKVVNWKVRTYDNAPARKVGNQIMIIDALDQINVGRRAYQYIPGQRRVKLAPDLSFDTPNPYTAGASTMDDAKGFSGAMNRYEWKLIGKQEKYIPHNNFALYDRKVCPDEKLISTKHFPNPECLRWELHRVWVIEATLKPEFRHIYKKRIQYWDEDGFNAGEGDNFDAAGKLYRVVLPMHMTMYESPIGAATNGGAFVMDLNTGIWASNGSAGCENEAHCGWTPVPSKGENWYSPDSMAGEGIR